MKRKQIIIGWTPNWRWKAVFFSSLQIPWIYKRRWECYYNHGLSSAKPKKIKITIEEV